MRPLVIGLCAALVGCVSRGMAQEAPPPPPTSTSTQTTTTSSSSTPTAPPVTSTPSAPPRFRHARPSRSTSIGGPNNGSLEGGVALPERATGLVSNPRRPNATAFYGTAELINAIADAAAVVDRALPGGTLTVNDIGFQRGGPIDHHGSHQAGRDADVLFYLLDAQGQPHPSVGVPIDPEGNGTDYRDLMDPSDDVPLRIDLPRTWRFVQALLENEHALVQRIFVVEHLRTMLLDEARRQRAPRAVVQRFSEVTCQPAYAHDDHLHVRLFCSDEDLGAGCADASPMYPWRLAQIEAAGLAPVAETRARRRSRVVTEAEARASAPPMHESVRAFLDRRESWIVQPHPGRRYCR
ncbi:MAG: penicillin-insensitive murein endopeptidase [Sandaracinaceae bacterium]|nr:penicillin-insensitive murein endopeptidase [Sandaracinaceae bacterium]